jgi:hypothetical protein
VKVRSGRVRGRYPAFDLLGIRVPLTFPGVPVERLRCSGEEWLFASKWGERRRA